MACLAGSPPRTASPCTSARRASCAPSDSRPGACAYSIDGTSGEVLEERLEVAYLGGERNRRRARGGRVSGERPLAERLIFAMGGGGFTMEPANPLLDDYVLGLARVPRPRVLFLSTASGDTLDQMNAFRARFAGRACVAEQLSLFRLHGARRPLEEIVLSQDIIYVGGGSMRNMLAIWRAHGLDAMLIDAWRRGTVLAGLTAGAMCWFEGGITRSGGPPESIAGMGCWVDRSPFTPTASPSAFPSGWRACARGRSRAAGRSRRRRAAIRGAHPARCGELASGRRGGARGRRGWRAGTPAARRRAARRRRAFARRTSPRGRGGRGAPAGPAAAQRHRHGARLGQRAAWSAHLDRRQRARGAHARPALDAQPGGCAPTVVAQPVARSRFSRARNARSPRYVIPPGDRACWRHAQHARRRGRTARSRARRPWGA